MASASSFSSEDMFLCSICLQIFSEPVSTPCGHNYCKACIKSYWDSSSQKQCPLCKTRFPKRPQLKVNTEFRNMVEHIKSTAVKDGEETLAKPGEVPCDVCFGLKFKAQKTCLVCLASYCQSHLEPHQRVPNLKKHQLVDPLPDLEDRVCKKHDKMLELYCQIDEACVCFMCLKDDHVTHEVIPLERAFKERKTWLQNVTSKIKVKENSKCQSVGEIKCSIQRSEKRSETEIKVIVEVFAGLVASLQRKQTKLTDMVQSQQKGAQTKAKVRIAQLELEVSELRKRRLEIEQLLQTQDHFFLLKSWPSLNLPEHMEFNTAPPFTEDLSDISQQTYVPMVKKSVDRVDGWMSNEMERLIREVSLSEGCDTSKEPEIFSTYPNVLDEVSWNPPQDKLMMIQQNDAVDVTLDTYTANEKLYVSEDGKVLTFRKHQPFQPTLFSRRFEHNPFVFGSEGFSSGRFYYEVDVSECKGWVVGVAKESIRLETGNILMPRAGRWLLVSMYTPYLCYFEAERIARCPREDLKTVGVFVDYEKKQVSFYDVETRTRISSFLDCDFTETPSLLKTLLYSIANTSLSSRVKLFPTFGLVGNYFDDVLVVR
ncbi:E3 ubiquitin-protein ligase TRIM47-like [Mugil cephalus]|uniref:E3 ubiquitin-protein ligase TRIM47-like n=1 Tax=Mugil cephalus TaxID=48193 RepID=UPI001FB5C96F|nr:E3 ubiquitin-protein ligase TRIM47-like [Mugil cephalus]